ncbi:hypothetical protein BLA60_06895 [Actinophytocola xinjiangensis]|uniref:tryptophan synthase n=1 Tax=Actinophytocola xinjiangensis TaxID=485602 RepID=A0A7Z0WR67_9PSEU|nr:tryptophan synthase subunit alpha [Actinophytocola xinjiangensis]OLF12970.1 hypothetical protein BLA60_06895 [Actinophytocola xinjiangensis]
MAEVDRIGARLRRTAGRGERLLVVYLTVGDPVTPNDLAVAVAQAGADVLELGIPTPSTAPRGAEIAHSFDRARDHTPHQAWKLVGELRARLPDTPLITLVYPSTVTDLGPHGVLSACQESGVDGLVLTDPDGDLTSATVADTDLSAIPLIRQGTGSPHRLEATARHLTYRPLAPRTGDLLNRTEAHRAAEATAATATRPFLAGFGLRTEHDIRAVVPHAAGVVLGSELYRGLTTRPPPERTPWATGAVQRWKTATALP